ncbi:MAG: polymerase subunit sigma-70 [Rhodospirillales bacterium]|nr:polymerase subunit sigma-70 [Rhodospirillales bacterium]
MTHLDDPVTQRTNLGYITAAMRRPLLARADEFALAERWRNASDAKALHELVGAYTRLVISVAARFRNYGLPGGDLIQEGNVGLMQAAMRFEPEREVRFSTYATWWIRSAMQDYVLRNWSIVRTGTTAAQKSLFFNLRRLRGKIEQSGENMSDEGRQWIADQLKVAVSDVKDMEIRFAATDRSLNAPLRDTGDDEWQDFMPDAAPNPEDVVIGLRDAQTRSRWLAEAIGDLSPREQRIIRQRRLGDEIVTLGDLGKELGISKERVRQLEQRAISKLRTSIMRRVEDRGDILLEG